MLPACFFISTVQEEGSLAWF